MFSDELKKYDWDETTQRIASKTDADVRRALAVSHCSIDDFMALLSPAAEPYLETMARLSRKYTRERFGRTMSIYSTECICMVCAEAERKRKDYARACEAERAAVAAGDRNFKGVGF